jgi:hypothetical protein
MKISPKHRHVTCNQRPPSCSRSWATDARNVVVARDRFQLLLVPSSRWRRSPGRGRSIHPPEKPDSAAQADDPQQTQQRQQRPVSRIRSGGR